jgi:hypothetical protein
MEEVGHPREQKRQNLMSTEPIEEKDEKELKGVVDSSYGNKIDGQWDLFSGDVLVSSGVLSSIIKEDEVKQASGKNERLCAKERKGEVRAQFEGKRFFDINNLMDGEEEWSEGVSGACRIGRKRKRSEERFDTKYEDEDEDDVHRCEDTGLLEIIL